MINNKYKTGITLVELLIVVSIIGLLLIDGIKDGEVYQLSIFDAFYFISYTSTTL